MRHGYGHMVLDHTAAQVRAMRSQRAERLAALRTAEDARAYQAHVRRVVEAALAPRPPSTPLNARITGRLERPGVVIEKVVYESRPGCLVTANLYLPRDLQAPAPCVLGTCGHSAEGKGAPVYQEFCLRLAHSGFVTLIYDPFNQGERDQYALLEDRSLVASSTWAHNMMGKQLELLGQNFAMWRAWDGVRSLDYLLSRPEVDPTRVGLTGNSGGGTMTTWLWAMEDRFTMAAPSCFVTTFLHNLENELPADAEQYPPGVLGQGLEMADFIIAGAPKPVMLLGQNRDYFDRRGHQEAYEEVRRFYEILGAPADHTGCYRGEHGHGYSADNQEQMAQFFSRHAGVSYRALEAPETLPDAALWATPNGNTVRAGAVPIYELIAREATHLETARQPLSGDPLRQAVARQLALPWPLEVAVPHYRNLRPERRDDVTYARHAIETEGDVRAILRRRLHPPEYPHSLDVPSVVRLYLPHRSAEEDLASDPYAAELQEGGELYALDVRGLGESSPDEETPFWHPYGIDYMMHGYATMFGESYLGRRVYDVLRAVALLRDQGAQEVLLYGRGQGALLALYAALLEARIDRVILMNGPTAYQEWVSTPIVTWPAALVVPGALQVFDLPDCVAALGDRVEVVSSWDARMQPAS